MYSPAILTNNTFDFILLKLKGKNEYFEFEEKFILIFFLLKNKHTQ